MEKCKISESQDGFRDTHLFSRSALVTGASRGLGAVISYDLASRGAKVVINFKSDSSRDKAEALVARIKNEAKSDAILVQGDIGAIDTPRKMVEASLATFGPHIDIVVNNAGLTSVQTIETDSVQHFAEMFAVNTRAPLLLVQASLPHLRRPGRIINICSIGSREGAAGFGTYAASKAATTGYTRGWAVELGQDGTTVNAVNPGPIAGENLDAAPEEYVAPQKARTPLQNRIGTPEEIAEIVAFLAEPRSGWVTGQVISASGGFHQY